MQVPGTIEGLIDALSTLPGIGPKTAGRLAYFLLSAPPEVAQRLAAAMREARQAVRRCSTCQTLTVTDPCPVCVQSGRDRELLLVVEDPRDLLAIERTGRYRGLYHVLHGALSPLAGIGPEDLTIGELLRRLQRGPVREVILATNPSVEGEATALYLTRLLVPRGVAVSRIARGLPAGGDVEYADPVTLVRALEGRQQVTVQSE